MPPKWERYQTFSFVEELSSWEKTKQGAQPTEESFKKMIRDTMNAMDLGKEGTGWKVTFSGEGTGALKAYVRVSAGGDALTERELLNSVRLNQEKYIDFMSERNPNMIFEDPNNPEKPSKLVRENGSVSLKPKTHRAVWNATRQTYEALPVNGLTTDVQWSRVYENSKGQLQVMDMNNPENIMVLDDSLPLSRTPPDFSQDDTDPVTSLQLADGSTVQYFMVGGKLVQYRSTCLLYTSDAADE